MPGTKNSSLLLEASLKHAEVGRGQSFLTDLAVAERVASVATCESNRAGTRLLMACMLAKLDRPGVDPRKPYTRIRSKDSFSGRTYDEQFIGDFIIRHNLPLNSTTAFLTPTLRNMDQPLTTEVVLVGRPPGMYRDALGVLDDVYHGRVTAQSVLDEIIRLLLVERDARSQRLKTLLAGADRRAHERGLSSEQTVDLIRQHLTCRGASRLPVLIVAAAYTAAQEKLGERVLRLTSHNAADEQTGAVGDVQITLLDDRKVITSFEMKDKPVFRGDIDRALQKIARQGSGIQNYLFISTKAAAADVHEYARSQYDDTGVEFAVLDCVEFLRYFLHLFHRLRNTFLDHYQALLLAEPTSAVGQPLKEAFLVLRRAAESAA